MATIDSTTGAFIAGLVTSLHCVGMCGPMACMWSSGGQPGSSTFVRDTTVYHGARLMSYATVGALAGTLGIMPIHWFQQGPGVLLPWLMVALFVVVAFGLDRWIPKPRLLVMPLAKVRLWAMRRSGAMRATLLGLATPLIPCGPLYLMFGIAMANGSTARGAQFALAFGMGTLPLLWLAQTRISMIQLRLTPTQMRHAQRGLALCAAFIMAWRLRGTLTGDTSGVCCH